MKNTVVHTLALTLGILLLGVFWTLQRPPTFFGTLACH